MVLSAGWAIAVVSVMWLGSSMPIVGTWLYPCDLLADPLCLFRELQAVRLAALLLLPLVVGWVIGYSVAWVRRGFRDG